MAAGAPLLYLHPRGHLDDLAVPAGALACLNAAPGPKLGRFAFEVDDDELRAARVVALDLHWALALGGLPPLVARVRAVNPAALLVVGGIAASLDPQATLDRLGVDYVVQGDAETSFAALAGALLEGREPGDLPNVWRPGHPARRARMSQADFDATDCLSADWFPTLARLRGWPGAGAQMAATLPLARGCAQRCPGCYGPIADAFGPGVLTRSPAGLVRELRRAGRLGLSSLRLLAGKLPEERLAPLLAAAAGAGPFSFTGGVGLYTCSPPSREGLDALETAFGGGPITVSLVPPAEQVPRPSADALAREEEGWRAVAERARHSTRLQVDAWTGGGEAARAARRLLEPDGARVRVSPGSTWRLTRPLAWEGLSLEAARLAVAPLWTFHAARLLSPALARLLEPFRGLDDGDAGALPPPPGPLAAWHEVACAAWAGGIPGLPGLAFWALPVPARPAGRLVRRAAEVRLHGAARFAPPGALALPAGAPFPLTTTEDESGVRLRGGLPQPAPGALLALLPGPPAGPPDRAWVEALGADGFIVLDPGAAATPPAELRVALRVQEAEIALVDASGRPLARGRAELGYLGPAPPAR